MGDFSRLQGVKITFIMLYLYNTTGADGVKFYSVAYCYGLTLMNSIFFSEQEEGILKDNSCFETDLCSDLNSVQMSFAGG